VDTNTVGRKLGSGLQRVSGIALFTFEVRHANLVRKSQPICRASLTAQYQDAANLKCMCTVLPATGIPKYLQRQTFLHLSLVATSNSISVLYYEPLNN